MHKLQQHFLDILGEYNIVSSHESPLLLAISGGKDSMTLLHIAHATLLQGSYIAVYVDHGIRTESYDDGEFIRHWCETHGVRFVSMKLSLDVSELSNLESRAREARYKVLCQIAKLHNASCIVTAHHQTDQSETIMMRWLSGSSLTGLAGMQVFSGDILRPFLSVSQDEILAYVHEYKIEWREDSTNGDDSYRRNWLRNLILPQIREKYPSLDDKMAGFAEYAQEVNQYLEVQVEKFLQDNHFQEDRGFSVILFQEQHKALRNSIISYLYSKVHQGSQQGLSRGNIAEIERYILTAEGGTTKQIGKLTLTKRQSRVFVAES